MTDQVQVPAPSNQQSSVITASSDDFIIKQHTYQMCPTCPTFSIPIPVPKSSASSGGEVGLAFELNLRRVAISR